MAKTYPLTKVDNDVRTYAYNSVIDRGLGLEPQTIYQTIDCSSSVTLGASPRGWRQAIANGANATSTLQGTRKRIHPGASSWSYYWLGPPYYPYNGHGDGPSTVSYMANLVAASTSMNSTADLKAREAFLGHYLQKRGAWRGGNFLAEFTETVHMLKHPVQSLFGSTVSFASAVKAIRRIRDPKVYAKKLGNLWLGYSFGWKPLFDDIKDANQAIQDLALRNGHDSVRISGSGSVESSSIVPNINTTPPRCSGPNWQSDQITYTNSYAKYYGAIVARPGSYATIADNFGVNADDILPAVWEAIPWSFLVDYFVNVQQVIDSYHLANAGISWVNVGFKNIRRRVVTAARKASAPAYPGYDNVVSIPECWGETSYVSRGQSGIPYPAFRFKIPGLGSLKWVNMAALLSQISGSRPSHP